MGLPDAVKEPAIRYFKEAMEKSDQAQKAQWSVVAAAVIYLACKQTGFPRTFKEFEVLPTVNYNVVGRIYKHIVQDLKIKEVETFLSEVGANHPNKFLPRFMSTLQFSATDIKSAVYLANAMVPQDSDAAVTHDKIFWGKAPATIAGAIILILSNLPGASQEPELKDICAVCCVSEHTIWHMYIKTLPLLPDLVSGAVDFATKKEIEQLQFVEAVKFLEFDAESARTTTKETQIEPVKVSDEEKEKSKQIEGKEVLADETCQNAVPPLVTSDSAGFPTETETINLIKLRGGRMLLKEIPSVFIDRLNGKEERVKFSRMLKKVIKLLPEDKEGNTFVVLASSISEELSNLPETSASALDPNSRVGEDVAPKKVVPPPSPFASTEVRAKAVQKEAYTSHQDPCNPSTEQKNTASDAFRVPMVLDGGPGPSTMATFVSRYAARVEAESGTKRHLQLQTVEKYLISRRVNPEEIPPEDVSKVLEMFELLDQALKLKDSLDGSYSLDLLEQETLVSLLETQLDSKEHLRELVSYKAAETFKIINSMRDKIATKEPSDVSFWNFKIMNLQTEMAAPNWTSATLAAVTFELTSQLYDAKKTLEAMTLEKSKKDLFRNAYSELLSSWRSSASTSGGKQLKRKRELFSNDGTSDGVSGN